MPATALDIAAIFSPPLSAPNFFSGHRRNHSNFAVTSSLLSNSFCGYPRNRSDSSPLLPPPSFSTGRPRNQSDFAIHPSQFSNSFYGYLRNCSDSAIRSSLVVASETAKEAETANPLSRRLILLRQAESSWEDRSLRDHDRPLSKTGRSAAVSVSHKLHQMKWVPELILSSDAVRTRETLEIMQKHVKEFSEAEVHFISSFYPIAAMDGQTAEHLKQVISKYSRNDISTIMCMGHNKGWEEAASMFSGTKVELKTSNAALLEAMGNSWNEAFLSSGFGGWKLIDIVRPDNSL